jgi:hypothetical protein
MTASLISLANSTSVALKLSGEYCSVTCVPPSVEAMQAVLDHLRAFDGDGDDLLLRLAKHILPLRRRGGVVHVDDHLLRADQDFARSFRSESSRACTKALNGDIVGDALFLDEAAVEAELGVRGGGEADFDLLEPAFHQRASNMSSFCETFIGTASA